MFSSGFKTGPSPDPRPPDADGSTSGSKTNPGGASFITVKNQNVIRRHQILLWENRLQTRPHTP